MSVVTGKELPKGWVNTSLDSISHIITKGSTPTTYGYQYLENGINFVKVENIINNKIDKTTIIQFISNEANEFLKRSQLKEQDILFSIAGTIGRTTIVQKEVLPANTNQAIAIIRCPWKFLEERYIKIILDSPILFNSFSKNRRGVGMYNVGLGDLKNIVLPLPPLNEQKRIVAKIEELFSLVDSAKENLEKTKIMLKQYRQSILKHAFEGKLTEKWRRKNLPNSLLEEELKILKNKKHNYEKKFLILFPNADKIPFHATDDWMWTTLGLLSESMKNGIYKPKSFYDENGIACLRMYNIDDGKLLWFNIKRMKLSEKEIEEYELKPYDLLINRVNSRELVGKTTYIPENVERCIYESKNIRLRVFDNSYDAKLIAFWFLFIHQKYFNRNAQQTTGMASINQEQLCEMPIPYMSLDEQKIIVAKIEESFSIIEKNETLVDTLIQQFSQMKNSILKHAFEGKLVPQDPNDEPAEILLQRIKEQKNHGK